MVVLQQATEPLSARNAPVVGRLRRERHDEPVAQALVIAFVMIASGPDVHRKEVRGGNHVPMGLQELGPRRLLQPIRRRLQSVFTEDGGDRTARDLVIQLANAPWMRVYPQLRFSVAMRTINARISLITGGRPGPRRVLPS